MKNKQPLIHVWQKLGGWCNLTIIKELVTDVTQIVPLETKYLYKK